MNSFMKQIVLYTAALGLIVVSMGCSSGPLSDEEAEELRSEVKEIGEQLDEVQTALADLPQARDEKDIEARVEEFRDQLATLKRSLDDIDEALKPPPEPEQPPAGQQAPGGGMGGGGAGQGGGQTY